MNIWQRLAHKWFGCEYVLYFAGSSTGTVEVRRAYPINGYYFMRYTSNKWEPLSPSNMADTPFMLMESVMLVSPGQFINTRWTPLTDSLLAFYKMMPNCDEPQAVMGAARTATEVRMAMESGRTT